MEERKLQIRLDHRGGELDVTGSNGLPPGMDSQNLGLFENFDQEVFGRDLQRDEGVGLHLHVHPGGPRDALSDDLPNGRLRHQEVGGLLEVPDLLKCTGSGPVAVRGLDSVNGRTRLPEWSGGKDDWRLAVIRLNRGGLLAHHDALPTS